MSTTRQVSSVSETRRLLTENHRKAFCRSRRWTFDYAALEITNENGRRDLAKFNMCCISNLIKWLYDVDIYRESLIRKNNGVEK